MGYDSVLGFFQKLSFGTAVQTTTRQAFRLAERTAFVRNFFIYYAHIGSYVGSLHQYHAFYMMLSLAFLGAIADKTGVLVGASGPMLLLIREFYSYLYLAFFAVNLLPLAFAAVREEGFVAMVFKIARQLGPEFLGEPARGHSGVIYMGRYGAPMQGTTCVAWCVV